MALVRFVRSALIVATFALPLAAGPPASGQDHAIDAEAMKALQKVVHSYRERDAITIRSTLRVGLTEDDLNSSERDVSAEFTYTSGGNGVVKLKGFTCYLADGKIHAVHEATDHSYFSVGDDDSPYYTLVAMFMDLPYPHLAIAFGEEEVDEFFCMQFHPKAPWARPTSVTDVTDDDGTTWQQISLTSDFATMDLKVDPKTRLINRIDLALSGGTFAQEGSVLRYRYSFEYDVYDKAPIAPAAVRFDAGDRQRVDMLATLAPAPKRPTMPQGPAGGGGGLVGQPAPDLLLATSDGGAIDLGDLQGQIVVLDFWATWCGPCRRALPMLHDIRAWSVEEGLPVTVVTVNVFERNRQGDGSPDVRLENVLKFWADQGYTLPVAMDYTDEVGRAYGVSGIPATFVIRSDGVVHAQHSGVGQDYVASLKGEIKAALAALEVDDEQSD